MKLTFRGLRYSDGFALPTILLVSIILLSILLASIGAASSSRVALDSQYYNQLASQAVESGMARAKECLTGSGYKPQWATIALDRDLRPNTDCQGMGVLSRPYVLGDATSNVRTFYSIEAPNGAGIGSPLKVVGTTELVRTSAPHNVWRRYQQVAVYRIEPPEASACPVGFIMVPGNATFSTGSGFCVGKYEAKNVGGTAASQAGGTPHVSVTQAQARAAATAACTGCRLINEGEWLTIAHNVAGVASNWSGGSVGNGFMYSGHNDNSPAGSLAASSNDNDGYYGTGDVPFSNQRRTLTLSNGQVIWDFAGNVWEWTTMTTSGGLPGASGFSCRDWRNVTGTGSLAPNPFPSFGTPAASTWTGSVNGIGTICSDSSDMTLHAPVRGGDWDSGPNGGVFGMYAATVPSTSQYNIGFRITTDPTYVP